MLNFIKKILILLILFIAFIWMYGFLVENIAKNGSYFKSQWINNIVNKEVDCVIIGNSRASLISMNEEKINYFNLAQDGIGMKLTYIQLYSFFKNQNSVECVILQGDYLSFNKIDESKRSPRWLPYFSDSLIFNLLKHEHKTFKFHKYFPAINYILFKYDWGIASLINNLFHITKSPWGEYGYFNVCQNYSNNGPFGSVDFDRYKQNLDWLYKINDLCLKNNSKLIVITTPYFKMMDDVTDTDKFKRKLRNNNIEYFDFSRLFLNNINLFRDNNHLNCHGAKKFEEIITKLL